MVFGVRAFAWPAWGCLSGLLVSIYALDGVLSIVAAIRGGVDQHLIMGLVGLMACCGSGYVAPAGLMASMPLIALAQLPAPGVCADTRCIVWALPRPVRLAGW